MNTMEMVCSCGQSHKEDGRRQIPTLICVYILGNWSWTGLDDIALTIVTAGLVESNGSLPPGLWLTSPAGWLPRTEISCWTLRSVIECGLPFLIVRPLLQHCATMTSSTKPDMRILSLRRSTAIANMHKNLAKIGRVVPKIWSRTDKHMLTDRRTHTGRHAHYNTPLPYWGCRKYASRPTPIHSLAEKERHVCYLRRLQLSASCARAPVPRIKRHTNTTNQCAGWPAGWLAWCAVTSSRWRHRPRK